MTSCFLFLLNTSIGYVYYQLGKTEEAEEIFSDEIPKLQYGLDEDHRDNYYDLARIYAFQGDREKALKNLTEYAKGFNIGTDFLLIDSYFMGWHDFILIDPFFERLRDDPEFQAIVKRAQEEKAALRAQVREMEERGELDLWLQIEE